VWVKKKKDASLNKRSVLYRWGVSAEDLPTVVTNLTNVVPHLASAEMKAAGAGDMLVRTFRLVQHEQELGKLYPSSCQTCALAVRTGKVTIVLITSCVNIFAYWQVSLTITVRTDIQNPNLYHLPP
jgi:hypothetical protein